MSRIGFTSTGKNNRIYIVLLGSDYRGLSKWINTVSYLKRMNEKDQRAYTENEMLIFGERCEAGVERTEIDDYSIKN